MKHKQLATGIGASAGIMALILDGKTALLGAQAGIELCLKTVIPSLFPFFILSILLTSSFSGTALPILRPIGRFCGIPEGAETILISGFLGGYPAGAQCVAQAFHSGQIRKQDAERLLAFCNNAGPSFLFGMVAPMFSNWYLPWALWIIHIATALLTARMLLAEPKSATAASRTSISISDALHSAIGVIATVCGWVILFRVLITFLDRWILWILPTPWQVLTTGLLELSNGCCELQAIQEESLRFLICSGILAFGGICVTMQTVSVTCGLSLHLYFTGKVLQTIFSLLLGIIGVYISWQAACVLCTVLFLVPVKKQKKGSIQAMVGV